MSITAEIIQHTVALTAAHLAFESGKEAMAIARDEGARLFGWLRAKLPAPAQPALAELEADPANADTQAELRNHLKRLLTAEPAFVEELRALLPATTQTTNTQTASGNKDSKIIQNTGTNNTISIT